MRCFLLAATIVAASASIVTASGVTASNNVNSPLVAWTWIDALDLGIHGQPFPQLTGADAYTRLPPAAQPLVPPAVWAYSRHSSGLYLRFSTDASAIALNYTLRNANTSLFSNFPPIGTSGCDLLRYDPLTSAFRWVASTYDGLQRTGADGRVSELPLFADSAGWPIGPVPPQPTLNATYLYQLNLPSYNGVLEMSVGVPAGATLQTAPPPSPVTVAVYGTSITQGGITARPGQKWTNRLAESLSLTAINLGFCGACGMEPAVGDWLASSATSSNASLIIIDCAWNMVPDAIAQRTGPLVQQLRAAIPSVPILLMEPTPYLPAWILGDSFNNTGRMAALLAAYTALQKEGVPALYYVTSGVLYGNASRDPTCEGTHPFDHGHALIAAALAPVVGGILGLRGFAPPQAVTGAAAAPTPTLPSPSTSTLLPGAVEPRTHTGDSLPLLPLRDDAPVAPPPADAIWLPATSLALRGRAFNDTPTPFNRLPAAAHGVVRDAVWSLSLNSAGLSVGFATDSASVYINYTAAAAFEPMMHFSATGVSGIDLFAFDDASGRYRSVQPVALPFGVKTFVGAVATGMLPRADGGPRRFKLFLPLYNTVTRLSVGVDGGSNVFKADEPFPQGGPRVVWYGTSIAQGGVTFKPANAFTNVISSELNLEVYNIAFSGNCKMELNVARYLTLIDSPAVIIIDCNRNMDAGSVNASAVPLVQYLRRAHPLTPIVLVEGTGFGRDWAVEASRADSASVDAALRTAFDTLIAGGDAHLYYVTQAQLWPDALDSPCANGLHPTDEGMVRVADFWIPWLAEVLHLDYER